MPLWYVVNLPDPEYESQVKDVPDLIAPLFDDPLTRHKLSYLNGDWGSVKTTRAIELFRQKKKISFFFTPTHRLAKEMRARGAKAQTYYSFFRWSGQIVDPRRDAAEVNSPRDHPG
ncbi:MAG: hypothetical protein AB2556_24500 [Candidatus Thiodiazotropha sp.]